MKIVLVKSSPSLLTPYVRPYDLGIGADSMKVSTRKCLSSNLEELNFSFASNALCFER